jgi:hypothetical protein
MRVVDRTARQSLDILRVVSTHVLFLILLSAREDFAMRTGCTHDGTLVNFLSFGDRSGFLEAVNPIELQCR